MEINNFDPASGIYISTSLADESPLESGAFLIPANATTASLPVLKSHEAAVINATMDGWNVVADYVGTEYWLPDGSNHTITEFDVTPPANALYTAPFIVDDAKRLAELILETNRNDDIVLPVTSSALGAPHTYSTQAENRNFLNNLITLGNGGKFTCTDADDIKSRRSHTHAQLLTLAHDIEAHISAQFDHYELKLAEIAAATTQAELDAITW
jgi:hypothetical protein